jgi:hypothetical protein
MIVVLVDGPGGGLTGFLHHPLRLCYAMILWVRPH